MSCIGLEIGESSTISMNGETNDRVQSIKPRKKNNINEY